MKDPSAAHNRFGTQTWRVKLQEEFRDSGLRRAIQKLTTEIVDNGRVKALLGEADTVIRQLREMNNFYECVLLRYNPSSFD